MGGKASKKTSKKKSTELSEEEIQLLLKNTHFNRKQIEEWHAGFIVRFDVQKVSYLKVIVNIHFF
jgi:hypothetical protein